MRADEGMASVPLCVASILNPIGLKPSNFTQRMNHAQCDLNRLIQCSPAGRRAPATVRRFGGFALTFLLRLERHVEHVLEKLVGDAVGVAVNRVGVGGRQ